MHLPWLASAFAAVLSLGLTAAGTIDPNDKGLPLFPDGHPNITYLTDDNWDDTMRKYNDKPWIVDFYHPFCPHCKHFAPTYNEAAAYYKVEGSIYVGAISCMDHVKCRRVGIKGFPTLISLNFDKKRPGKEVARVVGTHTLQEVKDYISKLLAEAKFNETGISEPPPTVSGAPTVLSPPGGGPIAAAVTTAPTTKEAAPGEQERKEIWEESTKPMTAVTRLQDAASAFIFGLKQGVFMGREVLEDVELDSLKAWLQLVAQTFPGSINRKTIAILRDRIAPIALLDFDTFDKILSDWQQLSTFVFLADEAELNFDGVEVPEWQRLSNLFVGQGVTYRACALYTCGQWNMFHMLTMNPASPAPRSDELLVSVIATMRRFMKHFFGCVQCRDHFLEYNNLEMVQKISAAPNKPQAIKRWLWTMHNAVNTRIRHPLWPKPDVCPTCGDATKGWLDVEVDKWLGSTYEYREVVVPRRTSAAPVTDSLRKEADDAQPVAPQAKPDETEKRAKPEPETETPETEAESPMPPMPTTADPNIWKPKDAAMGIDNPAHKVHQATAAPPVEGAVALDLKAQHGDSLQGEQAPQVSLFAWYILPVGAVGAYLMFVRSRKRSFRGSPHSARE